MSITTLFVDIGGVLLTNGWDHHSRQLAAKHFDLDLKEMEGRHGINIDTAEMGKLSLEEYLTRVVFYQKRPFTRAVFREFMLAQSKAYPDMIELITKLKSQYGLKIATVSNETRELNAYRIKKFQLGNVIDTFISSCYVQIRKPDEDIYRMALDIVQVTPKQVIYIDDRPMFTEIAETLGIRSICHKNYDTTREKLADLGLIQ